MKYQITESMIKGKINTSYLGSLNSFSYDCVNVCVGGGGLGGYDYVGGKQACQTQRLTRAK